MCTKLILCLVVISLAFGCSRKSLDPLPQPNTATAQQVQADVERILRAVYEGDVETIDKFTHPIITQLSGGPVQARNALLLSMAQVKTAELKIESLEFPAAPTFTNGTKHQFVIVPTKLVILAKEQKIESLNYQLGVREMNQTNWSYLEGSRIRADNVKTFFSDFPPNYEFPSVYRKKL